MTSFDQFGLIAYTVHMNPTLTGDDILAQELTDIFLENFEMVNSAFKASLVQNYDFKWSQILAQKVFQEKVQNSKGSNFFLDGYQGSLE